MSELYEEIKGALEHLDDLERVLGLPSKGQAQMALEALDRKWVPTEGLAPTIDERVGRITDMARQYAASRDRDRPVCNVQTSHSVGGPVMYDWQRAIIIELGGGKVDWPHGEFRLTPPGTPQEPDSHMD